MKKLSFLLALVLVLGLLASCGKDPATSGGGTPQGSGDPTGTDEEIVLTYVTLTDNTGTTEQIARMVEAQFPNVKIELQEVPGNSDDMKKSLITSLAAEQDEPDLFNMDVIWTTQFAAAGWLLDLTDLYDPADFMDGPLSTVTHNGRRWAVPSYTDVQALYYRTDLLDHPPASWDELVEMCEEHQGKNGIEWGFLWQGFQGEPIVCNGLTFIKSNGGHDLVDGVPAINSPEAVEALEFMRSLIDKGITSEEVLTQKPADQMPVFMEGNALFMLSWPGYYQFMQTADNTKIADKFSVAIFPAGPSGTNPAPTVGGWNIAVNANTKYPEIAAQVAAYMGGVECGTARALGNSTLPANRAVFDNPEVAAANPCVALTKESLQFAASRPNSTDYPAMSQLIAVNLNKALAMQMGFEDALAGIEKGMLDLIA